MPKIKVHEKALGHLSRGLYRSPASAIRELVSNAWDANATVVRVTTNHPNFLQVAVEDNGEGFALEEFERLMRGGIGNSEKRVDGPPLKYGRPTIGRLGIGMFGIAQIAPGFTITSKTADGRGFRASIRLYDSLKGLLDKNDPTVVSDKEVYIGQYEIDKEFDPADRETGTTIIADDLHPQFTQAFQESIVHAGFKDVPKTWRKAVGILSHVESLQLLGDYWRLIWELAASTPIRYFDDTVIPDEAIKRDQKRLKSYNFRVLVDGLELSKPIDFENDKTGYLVHQIESTTERVYQKSVTFHGYIAARDGLQIKPDELRGLMIRIKNVGIGYYDQTLLDYRVNQGPRSRWVTGEIYVDAGLEDALNVDRDSFNRFHPEFRAIQSYIHTMLKTTIFPDVYRKMERRSEKRTLHKETARKQHLEDVVEKVLESPVEVRDVAAQKGKDEPPTVTVKDTAKGLIVSMPPAESIRTKKAYQQSAAAILAIFEVALQEKTEDQKRKVFTQLLLELFKGW